MQPRFTLAFLTMFVFVLPVTTATASTWGGSFASQYQWDTRGLEGSQKWQTHGGYKEYNDASGGDPWDIKYLGTGIDKHGDKSRFKFGAVGGSILSGKNRYGSQKLFLSDIAINVATTDDVDPTINSSGWDYAIRLLGLSDNEQLKHNQKQANFEILKLADGSKWLGADIYNGAQGHVTDTFKMEEGQNVGKFSGIYTKNGKGHNVLEGSFDLSLLSLFDEKMGGRIITYLTMSCVNDEAIVYADIAAVPVPAAFWLFGTALLGFIGMSRRTAV